MSFGTFARKVKDASSPYGRRINALAGCVQLCRPLRYLATFGYLHHVAGPFRRDEAALLRALDALMTSRGLWLAEVEVYAATRMSKLSASRPLFWSATVALIAYALNS